MPVRSVPSPNLARRPFVNKRPVRRVAGLLWAVGGSLLLVNGVLVGTNLSDTSASREEASRLEEELSNRASSVRELDRELRGFALEGQNEQVRFLNRKIAQRTFPWSRLFDDLTDAMPAQVRLVRLTPRVADETAARQNEEWRDWVELEINGQAAEGEALLEFIDALFSHSAFAAPTLDGERRESSAAIEFGLRVYYQPRYDEEPQLEQTDDTGEESDAPAAVVDTASTGGGR